MRGDPIVILLRYFVVGYLVLLWSSSDATILGNYFFPKTIFFLSIYLDPVLLHLSDHLVDLKKSFAQAERQFLNALL